MEAIKGEVAARGLDVDIDITSCIGMCYAEPVVEISLPGAASVVYGGVYPDKVPQLIESHVVGKTPVTELAVIQIPRDAAAPYEGISAMGKSAYYEKQIALGNLAPWPHQPGKHRRLHCHRRICRALRKP